MVSKDPNECCLSVWKQHHSIVALIVLWQLFDSQRMESINVNTRVKTQGKSSAKARTGKLLLKPREKNCRTRFHQVPLGFVSIQSTCSLTAALCASVCVWTSVPNDVRCTPLSGSLGVITQVIKSLMISLLGGVSPALALAYFCFRTSHVQECRALHSSFFIHPFLGKKWCTSFHFIRLFFSVS